MSATIAPRRRSVSFAIRRARHDRIVLLDSDAHPVAPDWLEASVDRLDPHRRLVGEALHYRLAGAIFHDKHRGNPHRWYIHPHFMAFFKADLDRLVVLRKRFGEDTDTGEEATMRVLAAGHEVIGDAPAPPAPPPLERQHLRRMPLPSQKPRKPRRPPL
jgi:hypothetical protein